MGGKEKQLGYADKGGHLVRSKVWDHVRRRGQPLEQLPDRSQIGEALLFAQRRFTRRTPQSGR